MMLVLMRLYSYRCNIFIARQYSYAQYRITDMEILSLCCQFVRLSDTSIVSIRLYTVHVIKPF